MKHLILAQSAAEGQKKGKPGQLVDPRPEAVEGGEIKIRITPQLVHDIFDEYPIVSTAYSENVPNKVWYKLDRLQLLLKPSLSSCRRSNSGNDTSSQSCSMHTERLSVHQLHSMLLKMTLYSTSTWNEMMMVSNDVPYSRYYLHKVS